MEVEMFKLIVDSDECLKQARLLYYRYIHPSAKSQINVSAKLNAQLEATMATGIWDQTLYDGIQVSVHECLKFSVVRDFCQYMSKRKTMLDPDPDSATAVMLERYEGALQRADKDKEKENFSTVRIRGPNLGLGWLKKKSIIGGRPKDKKSSFLSKTRPAKAKTASEDPTVDANVGIAEEAPSSHNVASESIDFTDPDDPVPHRERLTQQRLQQQIHLLRALHQHQHENFKEPDHQYSTLEFANTTSNATPLAKSISMPTIIRGMSMANLKKS